jgi:antitoxin VapB
MRQRLRVITVGGHPITPFDYDYTMALNIKDDETERLAHEVAELTGESKTGAVRNALRERRAHLILQQVAGNRERALRMFLEEEVWPAIPDDALGHAPSVEEQESILGYGPEGM